MSAPDADSQAALHAHGDTPGHGSMKSYLIGFFLSVVLTAVPFWLVMTGALGNAQATVIAIVAMAMIQIIVHIVCFLHVNRSAEGGWTLVSLVFTSVVLLIMVVGSLWIMYHLNSNMMPMSAGGNGGIP
ncbi:cytochrome o ubiquinol oxidase subunit IV [Sphingomonas ginkgonis]|uniref:Cytochrome bo(3) ubiquinol oxidase subunit 4 n=1 Tax=Sphingomonas ginkgonis TaxID=2315330 RepID=A0A3R9WR27_9SPHN|nr:cytochrome o ubiquinol oxidase subunit IV [Sphingomonas ginkgonis]RST31389.1 cytochrome o ubiquinol oxidase subunit IV [Sphingomonas ginkgonis]